MSHSSKEYPNDIAGVIIGMDGDKYILSLFRENEAQGMGGGNNVLVDFPEPFHYSVGDEVPRKHLGQLTCLQCGNEKMYDQTKEEYYCPLGHDNL